MLQQYNLIVAGAGAAGMPCAIEAAQRGLRVLVVEKAAEPGGTLHLTAGHLSAAGTRWQAAKGITDSPPQHYEDVLRISHHTANPVIAKLATDLAPQTLDWLEDIGYPFHEAAPIIIYGHEAYSQPRTYFASNDYMGKGIAAPGKAVLQVLLPLWEQQVAAGGIHFMGNSSLQSIIVNDQKAVGVIVQQDGLEQQYYAPNIVLCTGGYASNAAFFSQHTAVPNRLLSTANPNCMGDGIVSAIAVGAVFTGAEKHMSTLGGVELEPGSGRADFWKAWARVSNSMDRKPREIYINENGERFMNEHELTVDQRERIVLQQPGQRFWVIFDAVALNAGSCVVVQWDAERFKAEAAKEKCCWAADSIAELAQKIKVPVDALEQTVAHYNQYVVHQKDEAFGRSYLEYPVVAPPFYALLTYAYSLISFGGLEVNEQLQVAHKTGGIIEGLYAAGEILGAGATSGKAFCGGMLLTPAISFGRYLGERLGPEM